MPYRRLLTNVVTERAGITTALRSRLLPMNDSDSPADVLYRLHCEGFRPLMQTVVSSLL